MATQSSSAPGERPPGDAEKPEPVLRLEEPVRKVGISEDLESILVSMGVPDSTIKSAKTHTLPSLTVKQRLTGQLRRSLSAVAGIDLTGRQARAADAPGRQGSGIARR